MCPVNNAKPHYWLIRTLTNPHKAEVHVASTVPSGTPPQVIVLYLKIADRRFVFSKSNTEFGLSQSDVHRASESGHISITKQKTYFPTGEANVAELQHWPKRHSTW